MAETKKKKEPKPGARPWWIGAAMLGGGLITCFLLMANEVQVHRGPMWGSIAMLVAVVGLLELLGVFRRDAQAAEQLPIGETVFGRLAGEPAWMAPRYT